MENQRNIMPNSNIMPNRNHQAPPTPPPPPPPTPQMENNQFRDFWLQEVQNTSDFKSHQLPLSRIKKVMKSDPKVHMISAEAPVLFAKACEMFISDLTTRSWLHAEENKRRTIQKSDISGAVERNYNFDFLLDVVPKNVSVGAEHGFGPMPQPNNGVPPYYYPTTRVVNGFPVLDSSGMYVPPEDWPGARAGVDGGGTDEAGGSGGNGSGDI